MKTADPLVLDINGPDFLTSRKTLIILDQNNQWSTIHVSCTFTHFHWSNRKNRDDGWNSNEIPGQFPVLHFLSSVDEPLQDLPPWEGDGLSHLRVLFCVPSPHVLEHLLKLLHEPQLPFTKRNIKRTLSKFSEEMIIVQVILVSQESAITNGISMDSYTSKGVIDYMHN